MSIVICPGIHAPELTQELLEGLESLSSNSSKFSNSGNILVVPAQDYATLSAFHILQFLQANQGSQPETPIVFVSFSAGVVGAIGAAWGWQMLGGKVKALIAVDGWGVPLFGNFPLHRLSHDYFTHWSSASLGSGQDSFYAEPPIEHLELWRSPQTVAGWWINSDGGTQARTYLTAAQFLTMLLKRYGELE
jgi:hypothetical protein